MDLSADQRYKKMQELSETAAVARSTIHKKARQLRTSTMKQSQLSKASKHTLASNYKHATAVETEQPTTNMSSSSIQVIKQPQSGIIYKADEVFFCQVGIVSYLSFKLFVPEYCSIKLSLVKRSLSFY